MYSYFCFGLQIASEFSLPELSPFASEDVSSPDLAIRMAKFDRPSPNEKGALVISGEDAFLKVEGTAHFRVRGGREIVVEPMEGAAERNVRLFLLGSAFGVLCHARGLLPLHANAIVVDGNVFAFCGRTGIGKSTLAAHFQSRGYDVLCDDVCVVSLDSAGTPLAWPGLPRLKLWRDAAEAFGHDSDKLDRAIEGMEKFHIPLNKTSVRRALPLSRVYVLDNAPDGETPRIKPLSGKEALQAIMVNTYRRNFVKQMGLTRESFLRAATVVRSISVFEAARKRGFDVFENEAARLERHFKEGAIEPEMALAAGEKETSRWKR